MGEVNPSQPVRRVPAQFARKFGPTYSQLDNLANASLGSRDLGQVNVDCKFRLSNTRWGVLGAEKTPAGILYMDLVFDQPRDCQLRRADVEIVLEEADEDVLGEVSRSERSKATSTRPATTEPEENINTHTNINIPLQLTDFFGPKQLVGLPTEVAAKKTWRLIPELNILGNGGGGLGRDWESNFMQTSRWTFTGHIMPCAASANIYDGKCKQYSRKVYYKGETGQKVWDDHVRPSWNSGKNLAVYRRLKWSLDEDDFQCQARHSNVIHTAFTLQHDLKPFNIQVNISGKLHRRTDRVKGSFKRLLTFPAQRTSEQGRSTTLVRLDKEAKFTRPLDPIAQDLARSMELANVEASRVEMPDALPVSFEEVAPPIREQRPVPAVDTSLPASLEEKANESPAWRAPEPRRVQNPPSTSIRMQQQLPSRSDTPVVVQDHFHPSHRDEAPVRLAKKTHLPNAEPQDPLRRRNNRVQDHDFVPPKAVELGFPVDKAESRQESELDLLATQISQFPTLLVLLQWVVYALSFLPRPRNRGYIAKQGRF